MQCHSSSAGEPVIACDIDEMVRGLLDLISEFSSFLYIKGTAYINATGVRRGVTVHKDCMPYSA